MNFFKLKNFNFQQVGKEVVQIEREGLDQLDQYINENFTHTCELIYQCRGKVVIMGMGKSGHIGKKIASTFSSTGTPSFFLHPAEASHGDLGMISNSDVILAISNSGESLEILALIPLLRYRQIPVIAITGHEKSTIARYAKIHLCVKVPQEACSLGLAPTSSTTATLVMGDALAVALLKSRGFTQEDFALSHPGGALGRKLLMRVDDIMCSGDNLPYIHPNTYLCEAVLEMTSKKMGIIVICDHEKNIEGIFTNSDLRRVFNDNIDIHRSYIASVMTPRGISVRPGTLAIEALNIMKKHNITSIIISDQNQLIGLVHIHDIYQAGIM
ncbi:Arabinose 5-phosphate isomerase KdsD [Candidatus Erwinia haradaeae]|uniref:Arabinose 5-phosphate isomerase n=1 Tax=Candidatus Erwinia haradaeae TaxID=1922217 RepID=A0A451D8V9_9GAMM|nr:arabinose-5-phosphate isomerase KdsD [Candidatus Erwinia haradaeae]VFP82262.1 Arabinose 5-phosphate isomerase KdsD [Candidatus Erwinia haradaeae]